MGNLAILLFATLAPAAVLFGAGIWALRKESGDVTRAIGIAAIVGGMLLVILTILMVGLVQTGTESMGP